MDDKQALREEIEKAARVHFDVAVAGEDGFDRPQKVVEIRLDELLGIIDAYTEQRVAEAYKKGFIDGGLEEDSDEK